MSAAHEVIDTFVRTSEDRPVDTRDGIDVSDQGVAGEHVRGPRRHVTLLFADDWADAVTDLGHDVSPAARRANVLLSGSGGGGAWIGKHARLGEVEMEIVGEVRPCALMDEAADGLQDALRPACRGGVWGRVITPGRIVRGDRLESIIAD